MFLKLSNVCFVGIQEFSWCRTPTPVEIEISELRLSSHVILLSPGKKEFREKWYNLSPIYVPTGERGRICGSMFTAIVYFGCTAKFASALQGKQPKKRVFHYLMSWDKNVSRSESFAWEHFPFWLQFSCLSFEQIDLFKGLCAWHRIKQYYIKIMVL